MAIAKFGLRGAAISAILMSINVLSWAAPLPHGETPPGGVHLLDFAITGDYQLSSRGSTNFALTGQALRIPDASSQYDRGILGLDFTRILSNSPLAAEFLALAQQPDFQLSGSGHLDLDQPGAALLTFTWEYQQVEQFLRLGLVDPPPDIEPLLLASCLEFERQCHFRVSGAFSGRDRQGTPLAGTYGVTLSAHHQGYVIPGDEQAIPETTAILGLLGVTALQSGLRRRKTHRITRFPETARNKIGEDVGQDRNQQIPRR